MVKVAINGFGRIGRLVLRNGLKNEELDFVAINDLSDPEQLKNLFEYDTVHGKYEGEVKFEDNTLIIDDNEIKFYNEKDPEKLPWSKEEVDFVAECTGAFTKNGKAKQHISSGAEKVVVSAPCKCDGKVCPPETVKTIVMGVNEESYNPGKHDVVSNASCTTNSAAPIMKIIEEEYGIREGYISTIHSYTGSQNLVDAPNKKDMRRARAASENIIPTSTGAANAVEEVIPSLKGKMDGMAFRVPHPSGSITDFTIKTEKETSKDEINKLMENKSQEEKLKNIIKYSEEPLVSSDIHSSPYSAIIDSEYTKVVNEDLIKILAWYDNEYGFSKRMIDLIDYMKE